MFLQIYVLTFVLHTNKYILSSSKVPRLVGILTIRIFLSPFLQCSLGGRCRIYDADVFVGDGLPTVC